MQHALRLTIIYHAVGQNTRTKIKKDVFLSKMPFDECSAAMGFQVGFKSVGFFFVFKGYCVFDTPRSEFWCVRHITFIVFFQTGFQIFGTADIEMGSGCFVNEDVYVMIVRHKLRSSFCLKQALLVMPCRVARLPSSCFALCRAKSAIIQITVEWYHHNIARLPSSCFALRRAKSAIIQITVEWYHRNIARLHLLPQITPRQSSPPGSLVNPFAAQLACRGEISALPRWRLVEVARKIVIILLPSKPQNLFEFGAYFYLNKSSPKFLEGVLILRNSSLKLKMVVDNTILQNRFTSSENISWRIKIQTEIGRVKLCGMGSVFYRAHSF